MPRCNGAGFESATLGLPAVSLQAVAVQSRSHRERITMGLTDPTLFVLPRIGRLMDSFAIEEVQATLRELTWSMGYEHFLFGQQQEGAGVPEPRQVVVSGYPEA